MLFPCFFLTAFVDTSSCSNVTHHVPAPLLHNLSELIAAFAAVLCLRRFHTPLRLWHWDFTPPCVVQGPSDLFTNGIRYDGVEYERLSIQAGIAGSPVHYSLLLSILPFTCYFLIYAAVFFFVLLLATFCTSALASALVPSLFFGYCVTGLFFDIVVLDGYEFTMDT